MIFFLGSVVVHILQKWSLKRNNQTANKDDDDMNRLIQKCLSKGFSQQCSIILRSTNSVFNGHSRSNCWREQNIAAFMERSVIEKNGKELLIADPQIQVQLRDWTSYISTQDYPVVHNTHPDGKCFVVVTALTENTNTDQYYDAIKVTDKFKPIAWRSGEMFGYGIIGECTEQELTTLTTAFIDGKLELGEHPLCLVEMCTVGVEGHAVNLLRTNSQSSFWNSPQSNNITTDHSALQKHFPNMPANTIDGIEEDYNENIMVNEENGITQLTNFQFNLDRYEDDAVNDLNEFVQDEENISVEVGEGGGEAMFTINSEEPNINGERLENLSNYNSPSKTGYGFGESGAGEALSPSIEDKKLLAPFRKRSHIQKSKPPNVLIYCGKKDTTRRFLVLKNIFSLCLNVNNYVIYHLDHRDVFNVPWVDNAAALIISCDRLYDDIESKFLEYYQAGGSVLSFSSTFDDLFTDKTKQENYSGVLKLFHGSQDQDPVDTICGMYTYTRELECKMNWVQLRAIGIDTEGRNVILEAVQESTGAIAILSQSNLDKDPSDMAISPAVYSMLKQANPQRFSILRELMGSLGLDNTPGDPPNLTPCVLLSTVPTAVEKFYNSVSRRLKDGMLSSGKIKMHFLEKLNPNPSDVIKGEVVQVLLKSTQTYEFNIDQYKKHLSTKELGNTIIYGDVVTSTMPIIDALTFSSPDGVGLIAIARSQTLGKGRGGNAWISPPGCAMFSLHLKLDASSPLGRGISYIQHLTSLAVVKAIVSLPGFQKFPLSLKWPNDIYYDNKIKVGGVIVTSTVVGSIYHINIGCGVNVSNTNPTTCINELIQLHNNTHTTTLETLSSEQLIARTVSEIENLVELFDKQGREGFLAQYYKHWTQRGKPVHIQGQNCDAEILGLDEYGYLLVKLDTGEETSVHPDGNSYDIITNLIIPKFGT